MLTPYESLPSPADVTPIIDMTLCRRNQMDSHFLETWQPLECTEEEKYETNAETLAVHENSAQTSGWASLAPGSRDNPHAKS